jgi:hypothetical protein
MYVGVAYMHRRSDCWSKLLGAIPHTLPQGSLVGALGGFVTGYVGAARASLKLAAGLSATLARGAWKVPCGVAWRGMSRRRITPLCSTVSLAYFNNGEACLTVAVMAG